MEQKALEQNILSKIFHIHKKVNHLPDGESPSKDYYTLISDQVRRYWPSRDIESTIDLLFQAAGIIKYNWGKFTVTKYAAEEEQGLYKALEMPYPKVMKIIGIEPGPLHEEQAIKDPETRTLREIILDRTPPAASRRLEELQKRWQQRYTVSNVL